MMSCWLTTACMHACGKDSMREESHNPYEIMIQTLRNRPGSMADHISRDGFLCCYSESSAMTAGLSLFIPLS